MASVKKAYNSVNDEEVKLTVQLTQALWRFKWGLAPFDPPVEFGFRKTKPVVRLAPLTLPSNRKTPLATKRSSIFDNPTAEPVRPKCLSAAKAKPLRHRPWR